MSQPTLFVKERVIQTIGEFSFTVCFMNIQKLCTHDFFDYTKRSDRSVAQRSKRILDELQHLNCDVYCLQEVGDPEILLATFSSEYEVLFANRPSFLQLANKRAPRTDGLALLFRRSLFRCISHKIIHYNNLCLELQQDYLSSLLPPELPLQATQTNTETTELSPLMKMYCSVSPAQQTLLKDSIATLTCLELLSPSSDRPSRVFVGNTHLYFNSQFEYIKNEQIRSYLRNMAVFESIMTHEPTHPVASLGTIICGDFNSTPDSKCYAITAQNFPTLEAERAMLFEGVRLEWFNELTLKMLRTPSIDGLAESLDPTFHIPAGSSEPLSLESIPFQRLLPLVSAMKSVMGAEPPFTTYTRNFKACIDYILFSSPSLPSPPSSSDDSSSPPSPTRPTLNCVGALLPPPEAVLSEFVGLPSARCGSDHISLKVFFSINSTG